MTSNHAPSGTGIFNHMLHAAMTGQKTTSREGDVLEVINAHYSMPCDPTTIFCLNQRRKAKATYAAAECIWYFSKTGDIELIKEYAPQYPRWANNGIMLGAVGRRLISPNGTDLLETALSLLKAKHDTRQCVMSMWQPDDLLDGLTGACNNVPCYLTFQVFIRHGRLHWITNMRSNDAWLGVPYDTFAFAVLQIALAASLQVEPGVYMHNVGSLHAYEKHFKQANEAIEEAKDATSMREQSESENWITAETRNEDENFEAWYEVVRIEDAMRCAAKTGDTHTWEQAYSSVGLGAGMPRDALTCCAHFLASKYDMPTEHLERVNNPGMRIALQREMGEW